MGWIGDRMLRSSVILLEAAGFSKQVSWMSSGVSLSLCECRYVSTVGGVAGRRARRHYIRRRSAGVGAGFSVAGGRRLRVLHRLQSTWFQFCSMFCALVTCVLWVFKVVCPFKGLVLACRVGSKRGFCLRLLASISLILRSGVTGWNLNRRRV